VNIYLITYDLNAEGQDYNAIKKAIESFDHFKLCDSSYVIKVNLTANELWQKNFKNAIDSNDDFHILELSKRIDSKTTNPKFTQWLDKPMKIKSFNEVVEELLHK
jgi:CRISPR/Cas system-associated endoribonuclease Cas2